MRNLLKMTLLAVSIALPGHAFAQASITLNWALWDWDKVAFYQPLISAYEKLHPDIKINHTDLGSQDYNTMLMTQLTGGANDIDIVTVKDIPGYSQLVSTKALLDLSKEGAAPKDTKDYAGLIEALTVNGGLYALPFRTDFWIVYYNKDLFDKAGVPYPTNDMTWKQFDDAARKLTKGFGSNKVYGAHLHTWRSTVELPGIQDGKNTLIDGKYAFLKPWYDRALSLQKDGIVQSYGALKSTNTHYSGPFFNQQIAMLPMGTWFIGTQIAKVASGESLAKNWGVVSFPHPDGVAAGTTAAQVTNLGVNARTANKAAAEDFVKWVSGPEGAAIVAATGTIPALRDDKVIDSIAATKGFPSDANSKSALKATKSYLEMPVSLSAAKIELVLNRAHDSIMTGNVSVDDGLKEMDQGVQEVLKK
ncbi:sugar ABC transporter substrate-binding protein [Rhizobium sp.]|jgi:multiple sugar transport system substrate-binding protein|uniref:ABC transporter substrate-binding protein n=1 Tax=Rhizobium sp. TaxID=391 RepID=UPI000E8ADC2C|nr:ABC transporter substrate-binding protein [Rhizobium sp.]